MNHEVLVHVGRILQRGFEQTRRQESEAWVTGVFLLLPNELFKMPILRLMHNFAMILTPGRNLEAKCTPKRRSVYGPVIVAEIHSRLENIIRNTYTAIHDFC